MAAAAGADEIQFDYVRFPAEGDQADAQFAFQKEHPEWPRSKVITDFVTRATDTLHPLGVLVSLDVFGVMAWARPIDLAHTGQNIHDLSRHCDIISPMIYPSHFFGFDGYRDPGDAPEHFISESMQRFEHATEGSGVVLRPGCRPSDGVRRPIRPAISLPKFAWLTSKAAWDIFSGMRATTTRSPSRRCPKRGLSLHTTCHVCPLLPAKPRQLREHCNDHFPRCTRGRSTPAVNLVGFLDMLSSPCS